MKDKDQISSITSGPRQSNFELLRIVAMFLVLVFHATFWCLGDLSKVDLYNCPTSSWTRISIGAISVICVNVFVLISGWFGIRPTIKGLCNFIFQCLYFYIGTFIVMVSIGALPFKVGTLAACFGISHINWFVRAYIALYIISPLLNSFVEKANPKLFRRFLISFFIFQTVYGWSGSAQFIEQGYSTFSFIGLYLLARYISIYRPRYCDGGDILFIISILLTIPLIAFQIFMEIGPGVHSYVNPLVITSAMGLVMWISKIKIKTNRIINSIAKSAFAVFLFHHAPAIGQSIFKPLIRSIYDDAYGLKCVLAIFAILTAIFIFSIILDIPRRYIWKKLSRLFYDSSRGIAYRQ